MNTHINKKMTEIMELLQETFCSLESCFCDCIAAEDVAKVHKGQQALDNLRWNMPGDSGNVDLLCISTTNKVYNQKPAYLHQCLQIIPCPLLKVSAITKMMKTSV